MIGKNWLMGAFLGACVLIGTLVSLNTCKGDLGGSKEAKIERVLEIRKDTMHVIDSVLKIRTKYIDTSKITVVHDTFNVMVKDTTHDTIIISSNQLRECVKCIDSLSACNSIIKVDSATIDSLVKIEKAPSISDRAKVLGAGVLLGIAIK